MSVNERGDFSLPWEEDILLACTTNQQPSEETDRDFQVAGALW